MFSAEDLARTEARAAEFVPTPGWVVRALLDAVELPLDGWVVEPAAGEGAIVRAIDALRPNATRLWELIELREDAAKKLADIRGARIRQGDYLTMGSATPASATRITNPPFSLAAPFFARMCAEAAGLGHVLLHVPTAFLHDPIFDEIDNVVAYPIEGRPYSFVRETCWIHHGPTVRGRIRRLRRPR